MSSTSERSESKRLLGGIENGTLPAADAYNIAKELDPVLTYFVIKYLRERYSGSDPAAPAVTERLVELTGTYDDLVKMIREGEKDSMREWFDDTHSVREFASADEYIDLIVDKLEG